MGSGSGSACSCRPRRHWRIDMPRRPPGRSGPRRPRIVGTFMYRADRTGYLDDGYTHLFIVPATAARRGRSPRETGTSAAGATGFPAESAVTGRPTEDHRLRGNDDPKAERCYRCANIYAVDVASGAMRRLTPEVGRWSNPSVSPDGRTIAFTGAPARDDSYRALTIVYTMSLDGSRPHAASLRRSTAIRPASRGPRLEGGLLHRRGPAAPATSGTRGLGRRRAQLTTGHPHAVGSRSIAKNGVPSRCAATMPAPPDIVRLDVKKPATLTQLTESTPI